MKRVLKIFGICLGGVIVGMALLVGCAWLFGAFTEKPIPPEEIAFTKEEVVTSTGVALRVTSPTPDVNQKDLDVTASPAGILDVPSKVTLDEDFIAWPIKSDDGYNVGGIVTVTASYNGILVARCKVKVDVPVDQVVVRTEQTSLSKGEQITFSTQVVPSRALNPWKTDIMPGDFSLYDDREKTIYYFLYGDDGYLMDTSKAYIYDSGRRTNRLMSTDIDAQTRLVAIQECNFYLKAFCFSTFTRQDYYNIQDVDQLLYSDGRQQIDESFTKLLETAHSESGSDKGQFVTVADVYIDSFTATEETINAFLYEKTYLTARSNGATSSFNLDMKLHPAETSDGYTYENLDSFIDNIVLEWESGAEVTVIKQGQFIEGSPADWQWEIRPTTYDNNNLTARLKATIDYLDKDQNAQTKEWYFPVQINTRGVSSVTANKFVDENGENQEYISLNSDSTETDHIKLEEGYTSTITDTGLMTHSYKYFEVMPQVGYTYSTFSLMKFALPADTTVTRPYTEGIYKITFEFEGKASASDYRININDGNIQGEVSYFKLDTETGEYVAVGSPAGDKGHFRAELMYKKTNSSPAEFAFYDQSAQVEVQNVLYYEQTSEYPFCEVNGVKVKTFFNSDTLIITRQLAELTVEGYGNFNIVASVVASDNNGSIIYNDEGNMLVQTTKTINVRVTNSVKDIKLNISNEDGTNAGIDKGDFNKTVVVDENDEYYIHVAPGDNTALDVLTQAVQKGNFKVNYMVKTEFYDSNGDVINRDSLTIGEMLEDRDAGGELVGYKFLLEVGNVFSIEDSAGEATSILFNIEFSVSGSSFMLVKVIEVRDHVLKEAKISYGASSVNNMQIYAYSVEDGVVQWKERSNSSIIDLTQFKFEFSSDYGVVNVAPNIDFRATNHTVNTTGIIEARPNEEDVYQLSLKNFPYFNDGVSVLITMAYGGSDETANKRYVYEGEYYSLRSYEDTTATYTLVIYGFNITYTPKPADIEGKKDDNIDILAHANVTIKDAKNSNVSKPITDMIDFSMVTTPYFSLTGTNITVLKSITTPQVATVTLMIGSNTFGQHNLTFKSPYTVELKEDNPDAIVAPQASYNLAPYFTIKQGSDSVDTNLIKYSFNQEATIVENGKLVSEYVSITDNGLLTVTYVPYNFEVEIYITVYEKIDGALGYDPSNLEDKGTWVEMFIPIVNEYRTNNTVTVGDAEMGNVIFGNGVDNYIDISSVYTGNNYELTMSFANHLLVANNPKTQFVYEGLYDEQRGYSICAYDIVSPDAIEVTVTLYITIPNNGETIVEFKIYVRQYMFVDFKSKTTLQSGGSGKIIDAEESYSILNHLDQEIEIGGEGLTFYFSFDVAPESISLLAIVTEGDSLYLKAKDFIATEQTAYMIATRKVYYNATEFYTIDYRIAVTVTPAA